MLHDLSCCSSFSRFGQWELFQVGSCVLWTRSTFHVLSASLLSGTTRWSTLNLCISCPKPRISHFSEEPWFFLLENGITNQDLGARCSLDLLKTLFFRVLFVLHKFPLFRYLQWNFSSLFQGSVISCPTNQYFPKSLYKQNLHHVTLTYSQWNDKVHHSEPMFEEVQKSLQTALTFQFCIAQLFNEHQNAPSWKDTH